MESPLTVAPVAERRTGPGVPDPKGRPALSGAVSPGRLRIAVVTETYPPEVNGVANTAERFVAGLLDLGHAVQLVRPRQHADDRPVRAGRYQEVLVRGLSIPRYPELKMGLLCGAALQAAWRAQRPDIVQVVTEGPLGWSAVRTANAFGLPVVSDFRTNFDAYTEHYGIGWAKRPILAYLRGLHNRTLATMVPTRAIRELLAARGFDNLHVIARGVDTERFHPGARSEALRRRWGASAEVPVVLYVGRLAPEKNLELLVRALDAIRRRRPDCRLVIVGDGPSGPALRQRLPGAIFAGVCRGAELATHYASADLFLFPSVTETYGNVTLEALASGLAVVAFRHAAAGELIDSGHNGVLAPMQQPDAFVQAAVALVEDPSRLRRLGQAGRTLALSQAWPQVVRAQQAVFHAAIAHARDRFVPGGLPAATAPR